jgi:hypothetical protein
VTVRDDRAREDQLAKISQRLNGIKERQKAMTAVLNQLPRELLVRPNTTGPVVKKESSRE